MSISPKAGSLTTLLLATEPDIVAKGLKGRYFDVGPAKGKFWYGYSWDAEERLSALAKDEGLGQRLFAWSEDAVARVVEA